MRPQVLIPYDRREAISLAAAAAFAGRSQTTMRKWCAEHDIGRRIAGGPWEVSRVALMMLLDGDQKALSSYLRGDRISPCVHSYFERAGINLTQKANSARTTQLATSAQLAQPR